MTPAIIAPDGVLWLCGWLRTALTGRPEPTTTDVWVGATVPTPRRGRMVTIRDDGGPRRSVVLADPTYAVTVWAGTRDDAADLARIVAALISGTPCTGPIVAANQVLSPIEIADLSEQPSRYMTFQMSLRCQQLV